MKKKLKKLKNILKNQQYMEIKLLTGTKFVPVNFISNFDYIFFRSINNIKTIIE